MCGCVQVLQALQVKYGDLYRQDNVVLSGTHTHSGLGGYFQYTLFMITSKGYLKASIEPLVNGIVKVCEVYCLVYVQLPAQFVQEDSTCSSNNIIESIMNQIIQEIHIS